MKCIGCGDINIVISCHAPLCQHCADNTITGGLFGDYDEEKCLLQEAKIIEDSEEPESTLLDDLVHTHTGVFTLDMTV